MLRCMELGISSLHWYCLHTNSNFVIFRCHHNLYCSESAVNVMQHKGSRTGASICRKCRHCLLLLLALRLRCTPPPSLQVLSHEDMNLGRHYMWMSGQLNTLVALPLRKGPRYPVDRRCVTRRAGLNAVVKKSFSWSAAWKAQRYSAGLRAGWLGVRVPTGDGYFSLHYRVQIGSGVRPASYPMDTRGSFPGDKVLG
jgi:hypothetical protein